MEKKVLFKVPKIIKQIQREGPSIANRLRMVEDPQVRMDLYLKACAMYTDVSEGTKRKWREIALDTPGVIR